MNKLIINKLTQFANAHDANGEKRTADLLRLARQVIRNQQTRLEILRNSEALPPPIESQLNKEMDDTSDHSIGFLKTIAKMDILPKEMRAKLSVAADDLTLALGQCQTKLGHARAFGEATKSELVQMQHQLESARPAALDKDNGD